MPLKKDGTGKRWVEMELIVPGTPEQVWDAMATGRGYSGWFTPTTIEERVGGTIAFDFGAMGSSKGEVTRWEPPARFDYVEREWQEGAPPVATEVTVTARSGGRCVIRMVHSLFAASDDWDDQLEGFEGGWPGFFEVLRVYLAHFAGQPASCAFVMAAVTGSATDTWRQMTDTLGLAGANVGDERALPGQPEPLSGCVERVLQNDRQRYLILRVTAPSPGIALLGSYGTPAGANASIALYHYGDDAAQRAAASGPRWRAWFDRCFTRSESPAPAAAPSSS